MSDSSRGLLVVSPTALMSGAETVLVRLVGAAAAKGWLVDAACPEGPLVEAVQIAGARRVHLIPDLKLPAGPVLPALGRLASRTSSAAGRLHSLRSRADLILVNGLLALPALRLARLRKPVVWLAHDVVRRRSFAAIQRLGRPAVSCAVAVSEAAAVPLRRGGYRVAVVRNGTPWPVAPVVSEQRSPPVVGCAAVLTPWKGQHVILEAAARLPPDVKIELLGGRFPKDGPYVESLQRRACQPDLQGRVAFVGEVQDALPRMRTWSVAVSASVEPEAGPLAVLEAMSLGLPLVGTNHGGTPEVLGNAGLLVAPGDPRAMADAVSGLLADRELWRSCHEAGPRQVADRLTLDRQFREMLGLLEGLAERPPVTRPPGP